eukprot:COSAG01_NODE_512_length_16051_cov_33.887161_18_plen_98_part_00
MPHQECVCGGGGGSVNKGVESVGGGGVGKPTRCKFCVLFGTFSHHLSTPASTFHTTQQQQQQQHDDDTRHDDDRRRCSRSRSYIFYYHCLSYITITH